MLRYSTVQYSVLRSYSWLLLLGLSSCIASGLAALEEFQVPYGGGMESDISHKVKAKQSTGFHDRLP